MKKERAGEERGEERRKKCWRTRQSEKKFLQVEYRQKRANRANHPKKELKGNVLLVRRQKRICGSFLQWFFKIKQIMKTKTE